MHLYDDRSYSSCGISPNAAGTAHPINDATLPHGLASVPNCDGRPIWEPPVLDLTYLITTFQKRRAALLKWTNGDKAKTTEIMDVATEAEIVHEYYHWACDNWQETPDAASKAVLDALIEDLGRDYEEIDETYVGFGLWFRLFLDGEWEVHDRPSNWKKIAARKNMEIKEAAKSDDLAMQRPQNIEDRPQVPSSGGARLSLLLSPDELCSPQSQTARHDRGCCGCSPS